MTMLWGVILIGGVSFGFLLMAAGFMGPNIEKAKVNAFEQQRSSGSNFTNPSDVIYSFMAKFSYATEVNGFHSGFSSPVSTFVIVFVDVIYFYFAKDKSIRTTIQSISDCAVNYPGVPQLLNLDMATVLANAVAREQAKSQVAVGFVLESSPSACTMYRINHFQKHFQPEALVSFLEESIS